MTKMSDWTTTTTTNEWTGRTETIYRRTVEGRADDRIYLQVYALNGRIYWGANVLIDGRPDLNIMAYGTYVDVPGALPVAKARASRLALAALRKAGHRQYQRTVV
jgi:hypothetical protein